MTDDPGGQQPPHATMRQLRIYLEGADPHFVKSLVKLFAAISTFFVLIGLVSMLPGADRVIPSIPLTLDALVVVILTVAIVGLLALVAPRLESLIAREVGEPEVGEPVGSMTRYLVLFIAVIVAHRGLAVALGPVLQTFGIGTFFDVVFLLLGLVPLAYLSYHCIRGLDPIAVYLARMLMRGVEGSGEEDIEFTTAEPDYDRLVRAELIGSIRDRVTLPTDLSLPDLQWRRSSPRTEKPAERSPVGPAETPSREESDVIETVPPEFLSNEDRIFALLDAYEGRMRQTDVVEETGWSKSKVSRVLSQMEDDGEIVRVDIGRGNVVTRPDDLPSGAKAFLNR